MSLIVLIAISFGIYWFMVRPKKDTSENTPAPDAPLAISGKTDAFTTGMSSLMTTYYSLRDAFVNWDTVAVNKAATEIQAKADGLPIGDFKADINLVNTAKSFSESVSAEAKGIVGETNIEQKRRSFHTLSEHLYNLIRTVQYTGEVIYHQRCPMAFNDDEEAFWLSNSNKIMNPYLGTSHPKYKASMLHCGDISDSLDFTKK